MVGNDRKSPVYVDELDDGHGSYEEEQGGRYIAHMFDNLHIENKLEALPGQRLLLQGSRGGGDELFQFFTADGGNDGFGTEGLKNP